MTTIQNTLKNAFEINHIGFFKKDLELCEDIVKNCQSSEFCATTAANLICEEMGIEKRGNRRAIANALVQEGILKN